MVIHRSRLSGRVKNIINFGLVVPVMILTIVSNWPPGSPREVLVVLSAAFAGTIVLLIPYLESRFGVSRESPD